MLKDVNAESLTGDARAMQAEAVARLDAATGATGREGLVRHPRGRKSRDR